MATIRSVPSIAASEKNENDTCVSINLIYLICVSMHFIANLRKLETILASIRLDW